MFYWARAHSIPQKIKVISILCSFLLICGINGTLATILTLCSSYYQSLGETKKTAAPTKTIQPLETTQSVPPDVTLPPLETTQSVPPGGTLPPLETTQSVPPVVTLPPLSTFTVGPPTTPPKLLGELKDAHILYDQNFIEWAWTAKVPHFKACGPGKIANIVNSRAKEDALVAWLPTMKGSSRCKRMWLGGLISGNYPYRPRKPGMVHADHNKFCYILETQVTESCDEKITSGSCGVCVKGYPQKG